MLEDIKQNDMSDVGRPKAVTDEVLRKLEEAFLIGATDKEACLVANIGMSTLYDYCQAHPDFADRKEELKDMPKYKARRNIVDAIDKGDKTISQWYMERKVKNEFAQRQELTGDEGKELISTKTPEQFAIAKNFEEELKKNQ